MSFSGMSRPARGAGLALLAVAVIAAVIGGITLVTGDSGEEMAEPPPSSSPPDQAGPSTGPSTGPSAGGATSSPAGSDEPSATSTPDTPGSSASDPAASSDSASPSTTSGEDRSGAAGGNAGSGDADKRASSTEVDVRVYNNSTIEGLASRAAQDLRDEGWSVTKVENYPDGIIPTTTAYYRKGTPEKAAALSLASSFGMRAKPRFDGIEDARQGVILIVTKDYGGPVGKSG